MRTIGLMSGTSLDAMDGVLIQWPQPGQSDTNAARMGILSKASRDLPLALRQELLALNSPGADELHRSALAANALSLEAATVVAELLQRAGVTADEVQAIGLHGQTVRHRPGEFDGIGYTCQLHNASLLAELTGVDVICDFRSRDVSAGGQGAPLVPAFHASVFAEPGANRAVLNLGGIANLTLLHADGRVGGFDCGPANVLLDGWCQRHLGHPVDRGGAWSSQGRVAPALLHRLQQDAFFSRHPPKSTGRDLFSLNWLQGCGAEDHAAVDVQATLAELTAWCVDDHLQREMPAAADLLVCGGGALNADVMRRLQMRLQTRHPGAQVRPSSELGLDVMDVEAAAFAWLARQFLLGQSGNLPAVTGARGPRVLGALYPRGA